jgi:hypothetical protein
MERDPNLQSTLRKKNMTTPPGDFEVRVMERLPRSGSVKSREKSYIRMIYLFFALGLTLGFVLSSAFIGDSFSLFGLSLSENISLLHIPLAGVMIWLFDKIHRIWRFQKGEARLSDI